MNTPTTKHDRFDGFGWEVASGVSAPDSIGAVMRDRFPEVRRHLDALDPDDRDWFTLTDPETGDLFVKVFRYDAWLKRLRYTLLNNQARKEWRHLLRLADGPVPAPAPVAIGERFEGGFLTECILVTEKISGGSTLRTFLQDHYRKPYWTDLRDPLWNALANTTAALAREGFHHRDYHDQNLIVTPAEAPLERPEELTVRVTDVHRARAGDTLSPASLMHMLGFLVYSTSYVVPLWESMRFYRFLERKQPLDGNLPDRSTFVNHLLDRRREHRRSRAEDCFKENDRFAITEPEVDGRWRVHHRRSVSARRIREWLTALLGRNEPADLTTLKERSDGRTIRLASGNHPDVIVKETRGSSLKQKCKRAVRFSKARRSWRNAHGLSLRDIPCPEGLALIEPVNPFSGKSSYYVQEYLDGSDQLDDRALRFKNDRSPRTTREKHRFVIELARYLRSLHREGVFHKDLKTSNILLAPGKDQSYAFHLIDLDRIDFHDRSLGAGPRIKNLVQVNASMPACMSAADRLRAWREYLHGAGVPFSDPDRVLREIMTKTRRREHVWP